MADVIICRSHFSADRSEIARFGDAKEVFRRRRGVRPGVTSVKLNVVSKCFVGADQQSIVVRGTRVFVGADGSEPGVRPRSVEEEASMGWIGKQRRSIGIALAEETEAKLADVLNFAFERGSKLLLDAEIDHADFRIAQVRGNRTDAAKVRGVCRRRERSQ